MKKLKMKMKKKRKKSKKKKTSDLRNIKRLSKKRRRNEIQSSSSSSDSDDLSDEEFIYELPTTKKRDPFSKCRELLIDQFDSTFLTFYILTAIEFYPNWKTWVINVLPRNDREANSLEFAGASLDKT